MWDIKKVAEYSNHQEVGAVGFQVAFSGYRLWQ